MAPQTLPDRQHAHQTGTGVLPQPAQPQEDLQASPFKAVQAAATPPLPRRPAALRTWDRWVKAAQASLARRRRSGASPAKASTPQHALSAAVSGCSSLEPAHSPSTVLELPSPGAGATGQPRLLLHTCTTLQRAPYWTPVPPTTRTNSASSGHADNTLHCGSAGLLHMPAGQRACPLPRPPQPPAGLPFAHSPMPSLPYPPPGPPFMLRPSSSVLCPAASVLCPAASLAGAAAASIVNRVLTAAAHAAQQPAGPPALSGPPPNSLPAALAHMRDLPAALAYTLELPTVQEAETTPDEQQQQQQQVCPLGLNAAGMAANLAAAAVGAANASSLPAAAADPLCTGALAIGASAAAIAANLTFLQPPTAAGQQQAETSVETARSASGPPSAPLPSVQPEALAAVAEWGAATGPAGSEAEQLLQLQQGPAQPGADAGLSVCSFCGGERPCHAPCPLAVATAALQGLHLQGIYATGRFRVACFVGDKASSPASTPRGSPTCSPTASSHSLCSGLTPTSGVSSPMQAALLAAAAGALEAPAAPAATPGDAPAATLGDHGTAANLAAVPATGSSSKPGSQPGTCAGQQLPAGEPHATAAAAVAAEPLTLPRSSNAGVSGGGSQIQAEAHQQPQQQPQQQQQLQEGIRPSRRHPSSRSLTGKLQRKGRFMVVEYNDLVDAAKAAAMVAMVSAGEEDGGEAAAKAAALDVVRDAAQTMQGGAGLPSCTSELNLAGTGCLMQQLGPAPEPLGTPGPAPSLGPPSALPPSLYINTPTDLGPQPAAAAAAAVAAAAVLDHAASSIAHAAISAATGAAAEATAAPLLAFESPDVQQRALAVLGWPGPMPPLEPQAGEAGSGEQLQPGVAAVPPGSSEQVQDHYPSPFLLPGAGPSAGHEQLPGSCSVQSRQPPSSYSPHGHLIAAHDSAPVQLGHVAGPLASPAVGLAGRPAHLSALPLLHSPPRIGSARGRTHRSPDSPLCTPTAPRAYRKGRFSIQELPSGSSKNVAQLATVASDAAPESAAGSVAGTPRADLATSGSPAGTPRAASPAVAGSPAEDAGTPRATTHTRSSPAPDAGSPAGSPAGQVAEISALPTVADAVNQVAAETAGGETAGMALVPLPMLGSSTQYAVIAVQPAGAETSGTAPETRNTGVQVDRQWSSHMQPASFAISTPNSLTDLTDAASSSSGPEGPAGGTSPPPSPTAGAAAGQASGPAAVAVGRRTLLLPKPDGADIALPPEMQCKLAYESVHLPASSTPGTAVAGSSSGSSSGAAGSSGGAMGTPSSSSGGTGEPASAGSSSGEGSAAGSSAGSSSGAAAAGMGYALQPLAPPNPLLANASNRWLLHNNTRVTQRTPSAFLAPEASFYTPPSLLQLPGSCREGLGPSPSMMRAASLGMGMGGAPQAGEDVVSFAQWMQHGSCWFPADHQATADVQAVAAALAAVTAAADTGICDLCSGLAAAPRPVTASVSAPVIAETDGNGSRLTAEQQVLQQHRRQPSKSWSWTGAAGPTAAGPAGPTGPEGVCSPAAPEPAPFHSPAGRAAAPAAAPAGRAAAPAGAAGAAVSAGVAYHAGGLLPAATSISSSGLETSFAARAGAVPTAQRDTRREGDQKLQPQPPPQVLQVLPPAPAAATAAPGDAGCTGPGAKPLQQQQQQASDTRVHKDMGPQLHHTQAITVATLPGPGPEPGLPTQQSEAGRGAGAEASPPSLARASAPVAKARKVGRFTIIDA